MCIESTPDRSSEANLRQVERRIRGSYATSKDAMQINKSWRRGKFQNLAAGRSNELFVSSNTCLKLLFEHFESDADLDILLERRTQVK